MSLEYDVIGYVVDWGWMWQSWVVGSRFETGHGRWGSLVASGLRLDVVVGFYSGGGDVFWHQQWVGW